MSEASAASRDYFLLRAEWLRFKNHVYDANSGLPTLPAVLDDARRLIEERGSVGLVYLDLAGNGQIEVLHGWQAYDEVLRVFSAALGELRSEGLITRRDIIAALSVRGDKFLLFLGGNGTSPLDPGGLAGQVEKLRSRIAQLVAPRLQVGSTGLGVHMGYSLMFRDPMLRAERTVHRALDAAMRMSLRERSREEDHSFQGLDAILAGEEVITFFQPILDLREGSVLGHEVFSRGPAGPLEDPERLFSVAERAGRLLQLERLCRRRALDSVGRHLAPGAKLFLNTSARALGDPEVAGPPFLEALQRQGLRIGDVVLEITERVAIEERRSYREILRRLKAVGLGIAIDDMGAGYSSLQAIVDMEPDYLKFDISLVRNIDRSLIKRSLLETLVDLADRIGAAVIAEGIEAESELTTLRDMGVCLGQGRHLAPPRPVPSQELA